MTTFIQKEKAEQLRALHHNGTMLVLPNIWDPLGALLMQSLDYGAVATASAAVAFSNGYDDGEHISFAKLLIILKEITKSVVIPVTADVENGYAENDIQLQENIRQLIDTGIAGINIEDTQSKKNILLPIETQCNRIRLIRKISDEKGIPIFINARTDVYLHHSENRLEEAIKRGLAYKNAGADGFFPIALKQEQDIIQVIAQVKLPLNILTLPGIPDLKTLSKLGVARVSLGPSLLKIAIRAMKEVALQLKEYEGLSFITGNDLSTDYLRSLINKEQ